MYREQLHGVPPGWRYAWTHDALSDEAAPTKLVLETSARLGALRERAEFLGSRSLSALGYVHRVRAQAPPGAQVIHAAERLLRRAPLPYVVDLEHVDVFVLYQQAAYDRPWTRPLLERALLDDRLRFLLPWSDAARRSVLAVVSERAAKQLEPKLRVVYPAVRLAAERPRERQAGTPLRALFVGTMFYEKGGLDAVRALRRARETHDVELDMVTYAPPEWAARLAEEPGLRLHKPGGQDVVRDLYARSDVLLFPSHMDTYGVVVGEAMGHGLPVLAPRHLALTETVRDEVSGLLFAPENMLWNADTRCRFRHTIPVPDSYLHSLREPSEAFVDGIAAALVRLAEEPGLHERLATGAWESARSGHLSMPHRQEVLGEIYAEAAAA
jgi:glycosyltransferase involved in cell wall biosynthesis